MATPPEVPTIVLQITAGPQSGDKFRFTDHQTCIVGRSREAHIRLSNSRKFSRYHCRLEINPPNVVVIDLGSTNGTKVNGKRVESASLNDGDIVTVGDTAFTVIVTMPQTHGQRSDVPRTLEKHTQPTKLGLTDRFFSADDGCSRELFPEIPGFLIERELGQGAMGAVFLARRRSTNEKVAIKVMKPLVMASRKAVERFRREASIVLRLQHKRIVKCIDFNVTGGGLPFLVMEYIEEVKVREYLDTLELPERIRISAGIVVRVLEGLQYAHSQEIVHRDVKPTNVLAYRTGRKLRVKLADFGLAKNYVDAGFSDCSVSNEMCGTLAYMPPEQIIDCRYAKPTCHIYAAGVCLYHLISGRLPYEEAQTARQISLILNHTPTSITDRISPLPTGLAKIVGQSLSREPSDRFFSAEAMLKVLLPFTKR